ncbi:Tektin-5 [Apodemus speciosus]|uniref:Tektin-5 n=1 Tax=Apodemus speciosus TaxID=105296 RepID=A0ABQ0FL66_APOSI
MHAHAQILSQHAPPDGLHLLYHWLRPLRQPRPSCQLWPLRRWILLLQWLSAL